LAGCRRSALASIATPFAKAQGVPHRRLTANIAQ
jgi:hypothetical protein